MAKFVFCVVAAACLISSAACFPSSKLPLLSPRETSSPNLRLRGGGWFDTRTPVYWPVLEGDKEEIPEDGSYGGHYSLEEVCGDMECEFLGEWHPWPAWIGILFYHLAIAVLIAWLQQQPWVPSTM